MIGETKTHYPNIAQSIGITGMTILFMLLISPLTLLLDRFLGKDLSLFIYYLIAMGIPLGIAHSVRNKKTGIGTYDFSLSSGKTMVLTSIATIAILIGVTAPIVNSLPMPEFMEKIFLEFAKQNSFFSFLTIVIAAPILEELIFRGIILNGLLKRYSPIKSIIISSILFGIVHLNPWQFISAFIIGLFSGWVYYRTGRLTLSILIHFVNNLVAFISMYSMDAEKMMNTSLTEQYGGSTNLILIIAGGVIITTGSIFLLRKEFASLKVDKWKDTTHIAANDEQNATIN